MEQAQGMALLDTAAPQAIPTPPDFPVTWEQPEDAQTFWHRDLMHFGNPITPLDGDLLARFTKYGFSGAAAALDLPIRAASRRINTYYYEAYIPATTDPAAYAALAQRAEQTLGAALGTYGAAWRDAYLPEIEAMIAAWESFDLRGAQMPQLVRHLDASLARFARLTEIHFLVGAPMLLGMSLFEELYTDLFGGSAIDAYKLLQGFDNKSLQAGRVLWNLSREARASAIVARAIAENDVQAVVPTLETTDEGRRFLARLRGYLHTFGKRPDTWFLVSETPWISDPAPVIRTLKQYIAQPDRDPDAEMAALAAEREAALASARAILAAFPEAVRAQFEFLLQAAQTGTILQEDHAFWIDFRSTYEMHRVVREFARRFVAAGVLDAEDDITFLIFDEIRAAADLAPGHDLNAVVAARRAEMARFAAVQPPPALGTLPPGPPPNDPVSRALAKFFGGQPQEQDEPGILKGNAGSRGVVRGTAKVIRSLADAGKLQPGDILVAETTAPPWTPLFATAAAVVTDTGGILSHCAVVAREYMIPAVVGTGIATQTIQDGQLLEVDGTAGIVRIVG